MNRPRVFIHSLASLDGCLDGFPADVGLYHEVAARLLHQAVLTGSGTLTCTDLPLTECCIGGSLERRNVTGPALLIEMLARLIEMLARVR